MTRYEKIAISLPSRAAERVRRAVKMGRAPSVSAYIVSLIDEKSSREDLISMLENMRKEIGGPPTAAQQRWVDYQLAPKRTGKPPPWPATPATTKRRRKPTP